MKAKRSPTLVHKILERVVRTLDVEDRLASHSVGPVWERAVGPRLADHTRPASLNGGTLVVEARSAAWMNEASMMRVQIRDAVNRELGKPRVRELRFRLGGGFAPPRDRPAPPVKEPTATELGTVLDELGDDEGARLAARARALQKRR